MRMPLKEMSWWSLQPSYLNVLTSARDMNIAKSVVISNIHGELFHAVSCKANGERRMLQLSLSEYLWQNSTRIFFCNWCKFFIKFIPINENKRIGKFIPIGATSFASNFLRCLNHVWFPHQIDVEAIWFPMLLLSFCGRSPRIGRSSGYRGWSWCRFLISLASFVLCSCALLLQCVCCASGCVNPPLYATPTKQGPSPYSHATLTHNLSTEVPLISPPPMVCSPSWYTTPSSPDAPLPNWCGTHRKYLVGGSLPGCPNSQYCHDRVVPHAVNRLILRKVFAVIGQICAQFEEKKTNKTKQNKEKQQPLFESTGKRFQVKRVEMWHRSCVFVLRANAKTNE